jgi:tetratricopeptide (TPR) repeat protein
MLVGAMALAGSLSTPAAADDREHCLYSSRAPNNEASRDACTRLISSGKYRGEELAKFYVARIYALYSLNQYDRVIADANVVITKIFLHKPGSTIPNDSVRNAYYYRGNANLWTKQFAKAVPDFNVVIDYRPTDYNALYARGECYLELNDLGRAIADFSETIRINPNHALAHRKRAISFEKKGDLLKSLADARRGAEIEKSKGYSGSSELEIIKRVEKKLAAGGIAVPAAPAPAPKVTTAPAPAPKIATAPAPAPAPAASPAPPAVVAVAPTPAPAVSVAPSATPLGNRVALVIGNSEYRFANKLINPRNDANDLSALLRRLGFDVVEGRDLDKRGMEDKVREFGRKLDNADLALFFYAGHGIAVGGKNYLIPVDAKLERAGDLSLDTIEVGNVLAQMEAQKRVNLVFLDACRDNPLARSFARSLGTRSTAVGRGLAAIQSAVGTMIAYATQPENVALDGQGRNSPFTTALLKHLATPNLDISLIMKRVRADVIAATRERQVPWDHSSLVGDVVLAR